jgi:phospholipid/cholesterol/gamma-HCH transport system substrate-binding protein
MKTLSNEVKVGLIAILTIVVFIWVFNFLKGKNLFKSTSTYYAVYDQVGGLSESSPVEVNGYKVGVVKSINFIDPVSGKLLVAFSVNKNFKIPVNTVAEIVPVSVLGGMKVQFNYGAGPGFYKAPDTIPGKIAPSLMEMIETEVIPVKDKIAALITHLDSVTSSINDIIDADFKKNLGKTMTSLSNSTGSIENILTSKEKELKSTLDNLNTFTKMLSEKSGSLGETFTNISNITEADIYSTVTNLKAGLEKTAILIDNMNNGKGSAGKFLTNDSLYLNMSSSLASLNLLLQDLKSNPKRYVHFSIFGKKDAVSK